MSFSTTTRSTRSCSDSVRPQAPLGRDGQLSTQYDFRAIEEDLYKWWEAEGYFKPQALPVTKDHRTIRKPPFTIPMPPPNVTGRLHMGHALFVAIQDILVRFQRMRGRPTLWLPGTDHAGIATQMLVGIHIIHNKSNHFQ